VTVLQDPLPWDVFGPLHALFGGARPGSSVLLYWAADALMGEDGDVYLTGTRTDPANLPGTATIDATLRNELRETAASEAIIVLDGAGSGRVPWSPDTLHIGVPTVVITSGPADSGPSRALAAAFVDGLSSGAADRDGDGYVSVDELYGYVVERAASVKDEAWPQRVSLGLTEPILIARAPRTPSTPARTISPSVRQLHEQTAPQTAYALVAQLLEEHPEYGTGPERPSLKAPDGAVTRPVDDWLADVRALYRPGAAAAGMATRVAAARLGPDAL
jgi:hypothetical protein